MVFKKYICPKCCKGVLFKGNPSGTIIITCNVCGKTSVLQFFGKEEEAPAQ